MSLAKIWGLMRKELRMGPRSPFFLYAIVLPVILTLVVQFVFGSLFDRDPRLGITDAGSSQIVKDARSLDGIEVTTVGSQSELREMVEANDLDVGLILPKGFDAAVKNGEQPPLRLFLGGESLASDRTVIQTSVVDLVRGVAGNQAPVSVNSVALGDGEAVPITVRLLPLLVIMAVTIAGTMVPAAALVQEKENGTLGALLVGPAKMGEVLVSKAGIGIVLAVATGVVTLALNNAFGAQPLALLLTLLLAAVMMAGFGLILGIWAKDSNTLFTAIKSGGILLYFPVIFYIFPGLPQWIAQIGPTYYFLEPIYEIAINGAALADVWVELAIGAAICVALIPIVFPFGRRLQTRLAMT